jgi:hypothetical protein
MLTDPLRTADRPRPGSLQWWGSLSGLMTAIGTLVAIVGLAVTIVIAIAQQQGAPQPGQTSAAPSILGVQRSPRLGIEIWQDASPAPFTIELVTSDRNVEDRAHAKLHPGPFEIRFPKLADKTLKMCVSTDDSMMSIEYYTKAMEDFTCLHPAMGRASTEYGDGFVYAGEQAHMVFGSSWGGVIHLGEQDAVRFTHLWIDDSGATAPTPLADVRQPLHLTFFLDHDRNGVVDPGDMDLVVLDFA